MKRYGRNARHLVTLTLNGSARRGYAEPRTLLSDFLRYELGATGVHVGCEHGICGACTVRLDGLAVRSCLALAVQAEGRRVDTVESLSPRDGMLNDLQQAFRRRHALQCGFCTPGILMACSEFLEWEAAPTEAQVREMLQASCAAARGIRISSTPCSMLPGSGAKRALRVDGVRNGCSGEESSMLDLGKTFLASVERSPNEVAVVDGALRLTYTEWFDRIRRVAGGLQKLGIVHGAHLLVVLQNRWEMATLHWACQFLGAIVTPLNWRAKPEEVDYCAGDATAKAVVYETVSSDAVTQASATKSIPCITIGDAQGGSMDFSELLNASYAAKLLNASADDYSLLLYTSGTTGKPKGVPRRHRHERAAALAHVAQNLYRRGERTLGVMPLYHTMGVRSLLAMALVDGSFVCVPRFDPAAVLKYLEEEKITNLYLVPTLYHDMLNHPNFPKTDIRSVRKLSFAGAPMNDALLHRLNKAFKPEFFANHYGSSEVYTFTVNQDAVAKPGSAGRAGLNQRIRVVKFEATSSDDLAAPGEEGQIIADLAGDEAFEGYWNRPDADQKSLREGWYFCGDTGYFDKDGDLYVTGRVDDMIISGGENLSPVDIESVISLHPAVDEVAVAGLPDERWGQKVVAFVKRKSEVDAAALDAHVRSSDLVNFKRPREYLFVKEIPKSPVGKILRRKLIAGEYEKE